MAKKFDVPILFLIFNRPNTTEQVFKIVKEVRPSRLFIAADGPREDRIGEIEKCEEARKITEKIDWLCEVKRLYRKNNLGCKVAINEAISWFFKNVDEGIVLEDDCVPDPSFFKFCETMLRRYRYDERIMHIGGSNFLPNDMKESDGYYFSKYSQVWGWATWRRAWKKMDYKMSQWKNFSRSKEYSSLFPYFWERVYWRVIADAVMMGKINSWAYRWQFSIWENRGKAISPGRNLVKNIGLRGGTHINTNVGILERQAESINGNPVVLSNKYSINADEYIMKEVYRISPLMVFAQWGYYMFKKGE